MTGPMATRLSGSSDLFQPSGRRPYHSINFITSHDGYTLNDLVSYERKHNLDNLEDNRDGDNNNFSANYGVEGPTRRKSIVDLRHRQAKNFMASLLLSQGVPMIVAGDEVLRTQRGNNNAYCQDNPISWFDWRLVERNTEMLRFVQVLIAFRRRQPNVRRGSFLTGKPSPKADSRQPTADSHLPDVSWYGPNGKPIEWSANGPSLTSVFGTSGLDDPAARAVMIMLHAGNQPQRFVIPPPAATLTWRHFIDTSAEPPHDIDPDAHGPLLRKEPLTLDHHTLHCYVAE
jgi:glycogen operon protein